MRSIECSERSGDGFLTRKTWGAEAREHLLGVTFHEQRDEVANWSALEPGVLVFDDAVDLGRFDLLVGRDESAIEFVDDLLFGHCDHVNQCARVELRLSTELTTLRPHSGQVP
ncbi:hypothetical protein M2432_001226 [Mycobacterium sp. OTB74]|nr:hypothetical protein [Mycobacterium sp. OTB74]